MPRLAGGELQGSRHQWMEFQRWVPEGDFLSRPVMEAVQVDAELVLAACNAFNILRLKGQIHQDALYVFLNRRGTLVLRTWRLDADGHAFEVKDHDPRELIVGAGNYRLTLGSGDAL